MKHLRTIITTIALLATTALLATAQKSKVTDVSNPKNICAGCWVSDVTSTLSATTIEYLNNQINMLNAEVGVEIAIVIVDGIEGDDEYDFAFRLFNNWHIGQKGRDNGLLLLYAKDIRAMKFETGYGLEGLLPDAFLNRVLEETMFPLMRQDKTDEAFIAGMDKVFKKLSTDEAHEELLLNTRSPRVIAGKIIATYFSIAFALLILLAVWIQKATTSLKGENNVRYAALKTATSTTGVLALVFPIPILFLWLYLRNFRRKQRTIPISCNRCGASMHIVPEKDEDLYLNFSQQAEERVKSIDYDVWKCSSCDNIKIMPYEMNSTKYSRCPHCGAKTYSLLSNNIILPATTITPGKGEKIHSCANCGVRDVVPYIIPIIIIPKSSGNSRGGFGGGSFGGGMSGGGGAGGRF